MERETQRALVLSALLGLVVAIVAGLAHASYPDHENVLVTLIPAGLVTVASTILWKKFPRCWAKGGSRGACLALTLILYGILAPIIAQYIAVGYLDYSRFVTLTPALFIASFVLGYESMWIPPLLASAVAAWLASRGIEGSKQFAFIVGIWLLMITVAYTIWPELV
jgi:hypothetical protein